MGLDIKILEDYLVISDGCEIDHEETNVVGENRVSRQDKIRKSSTNLDAHSMYAFEARFQIKCPTCGNIYDIGDEELKVGWDEYERLTKK
jgi:hypothetical protein